jgi:cytochrome c-type biogenesis protein CcmE
MAKLKLALIVACFVGVVGYLIFSGLQETTVYYHTVSEVQSGKYRQTDQGMRISGNVVPGSVERQAKSLGLDFRISDAQGGEPLRVHYQGVVPDNFKEGMAVVVEGKLRPGEKVFDANTILLKCPSKYEKEQ